MLPVKNRLTKDRDFKKINSKGKACFSSFLKIKYLANQLENSRFGIVVSSKVSKKAVERNKLKRRIREIIRPELTHIVSGFDVVIFTTNKLLVLDFEQLKVEVMRALNKAKLC
ncbi:MAG: ribonuclease P protein component [Patescibacteria group bacterium]|jgi:ribonuclease P protein component|nr:ribonuclease P protein component [Patescibacteria group bacterium]